MVANSALLTKSPGSNVFLAVLPSLLTHINPSLQTVWMNTLVLGDSWAVSVNAHHFADITGTIPTTFLA